MLAYLLAAYLLRNRLDGWSDGSYSNWLSGQPDADSNCVMMGDTFEGPNKWYVFACVRPLKQTALLVPLLLLSCCGGDGGGGGGSGTLVVQRTQWSLLVAWLSSSLPGCPAALSPLAPLFHHRHK